MTQRKKSQSIGLLMIAAFSAMFLWALTAVVWPVPVAYADDPEIITITVTSSLETYFYDPGLGMTGGEVFFNNLAGEGAGQVITVTMTVTGSMPITLTGDTAFGMTPISDTNTTGELGITYTIGTSAGTENGVPFTITNASGFDTAVITFTQDNVDPGLPTSPQARPDGYADTGEYDDETLIYFTWAAASDNSGGSGIATYYAEIGDSTPDEGVLTDFEDTDTGSEGLNAYYVAAVDHVGNVGPSASDTITIDTIDPVITAITVTSDSPTYFYAPPLGATGGEVFFNSVGGEGAGQRITVTVWWTDANPYRLQGDDAFNDGPQADTSGPPWTVSYSIENNAPSETNRVFTVTDWVSHTDTAVITFTQDNITPTVELTDVTDPGYDYDPDWGQPTNELDIDGSNWYSAGNFIGLTYRWYFTSTTSDGGAGLASGSAFWDHSSGITHDQTKNCGSDGSDFFSGVGDDTDGVVTATVTITDRVGNSADSSVVLNIDNTRPDITSPSINEHNEPHLHVYPGSTSIYYGDGMGSDPEDFDVEGWAQDDGVGLDKATYPMAFDTTPSPDDLKASPPPDPNPRFWSGRYAADEEDYGDDFIQVTVSDLLGNSRTRSFAYWRDVTHPQVTLTDVTDPDYDPDENELNATGNWYRTSGLAGWAFTSDTSDSGAGLTSGTASGTAFWDHPNDTHDQTIDCGSGGDGTFTGVSDDGSGTVTVTVTITDNVGNATTSVPLVIRLDGTPPSVPGSFAYQNDADSGGDGFPPEAGYYDSTAIQLQSNASTDGGSGLPATPYHLWTTPPTGDSYAESSPYTITVGSSGTYNIYLTAEDNVGNISGDAVTGPVVVDTQPPQGSVVCPASTTALSFTVSWSATDQGPAGLRSTNPYAVSYNIDGGVWQNWLANTSTTAATFGPNSPTIVAYGHTYCFRMRAVDRAGNVAYTAGNNCTVTIDPAAILEKVFLPILMTPDPNWGFETGDFTSWQHGGQLAQSVSTAYRHSGSYAALLGSPSYACTGVPVGSAWLRRSVTVPSSGSPTLSFWYRIFTQDENVNDQYDYFAVYINGSDLVVKDANTTQPAIPSCPTYDLGWKQVNFSLSAYQGQIIEITFYNYNRPDSNYNTYTYIDDVSVQ